MYSQLEKIVILQLDTLSKLLEKKPDDYDVKKIVMESIKGLEHLGARIRLIENNVLTLIQLDEMRPISRL